LRTERLLLRRWRETDVEPFAEMNADPIVMEYFPATLSRAESVALIERSERWFDDRGYGLWAIELIAGEAFVGFTGLAPVDEALPFAPAVELGWRLAHAHWGRGIATEAASAAARFAFETLELPSVVALTAANNVRSRMVMERLGMHRDPVEDFIHPKLPAGDPLAPHVVYRLDAHVPL
jgi:RimJ/RimL family protein N-acetyltransferase